MLQDLFSQSARTTPLQRMNPSVKILAVVCASVIGFCLVNPLYSSVMLIIVFSLVVYARIPSRMVKTFLAGILWMMLLAQISFTLIMPPRGDTFVALGPVTVYIANVLTGLSISMRLAIMTLLSALLMATTTQREMVMGVRGLKAPYSLSMAVGMVFRTIVTIASDFDVIRQAQSSRCLDVNEGSLFQKIEKRATIGLPLTAALVNKMDHLTTALECRAVRLNRKPIEYFAPHNTRIESLTMVALVLLTVIVMWLRVTQGFFGL